MARTTIAVTSRPVTGYNLTDSTDFTTMTAGAGNGVSFPFDGNNQIVLKNDSGGASTFTIKVPTPASYTALGLTIPDVNVSIANGKSWVFEPNSVWRQSDGNIYIDCSVAGKVLVLA